MQLLSHYQQLSTHNFLTHLKTQKEHHSNPLGVTFSQAKKIKRLLSGRLNNSNLTFIETFQNPQSELIVEQQDQEEEEQGRPRRKLDAERYLCFSLISKSSQHDHEILINFSVSLRRAAFTLESKLTKNYRLLKVESRALVRFMAKYFISYNGKLKQGSFFVNPITCEISYIINSQWTLQSISSLIRNPQKFLNYVISQVEQITAKWAECMDTVLYLINRKTFEEIIPTKKLKYVRMKLRRLSQLVIHSHVDACFFIETKPMNIPRFKKIEDDDRNQRLFQMRNDLGSMQKKSKPLDTITSLLSLYTDKKKLSQSTFRLPEWQIGQKKEFAMNLACHQYGGKFTIYSEIDIVNVQSQTCIFQSGFSRIYRIDAHFRRQEEPHHTKALLIRKKTQFKRYENEISVLKLLKNEKCLFFPRYYFCQQEQYKEDIFVEFIPESSIDRYLLTKSLFIGNQTKLFFLFQVVIALRFLRDNGIVHIDLKPQNVLVKIVGDAKQNVHYLIKLIDFGQSYSPKIDALACNAGRGFTIPYAPPQLLAKGQRYDEKTDVYSFGVIMLKIMFNHFPTEIMKLKKLQFIEEQYLKFYSFPVQKLQAYGTTEFISIMYYLCLKCIQPDPNDRPTLDWLCIILKDLIITYEELNK